MPPPTAIPAVPPTFHFKIRLVDAAGNVFAGKDYQIWWGGKLVQEGLTSKDGVVEADLDDKYDSGILDLGERDEQAKFVARLTIPIETVPPPPPPPKPAKPPKQEPRKPASTPRDQQQWTDEADPPPPFPEYPRYTEDEDAWRRYVQQKKAWDEWEKRRAERMREAEAQRRMDEEWRDRQKREEELRKKYEAPGGSMIPAPARETPAPPMSPDEQEALLRRLQHAREQVHAAKVRLYDLTWRLRNLGHLPDTSILVFPIEGQAREGLLHALRRYAHKNKLTLPEELDLGDPDSAAVKSLEEHIRKEHDG